MDEDDFKASVGKYGPNQTQCFNTTSDQAMIRDLLNAIPAYLGGTAGTLQGQLKWGIVDEDLYQAIYAFQQAHPEAGLSVDGHVDPHQKTLRLLLRLAKNTLSSDPGLAPDVPPDLPDPDVTPPPPPPTTKHFRIRYRGGATLGPFGRHYFDIWDPNNNRTGVFSLTAWGWSLGTPTSITGGCDDMADFTTTAVASLEDLQGTGATGDVGGSDESAFFLIINPGALPRIAVKVSTGYTEGYDILAVSGGTFVMLSSKPGPPETLPYQPGDML